MGWLYPKQNSNTMIGSCSTDDFLIVFVELDNDILGYYKLRCINEMYEKYIPDIDQAIFISNTTETKTSIHDSLWVIYIGTYHI